MSQADTSQFSTMQIMDALRERQARCPITLIPAKNVYTCEELENLFPGESIVACDFRVEDIMDGGEQVVGGYRKGRILNIDHHMPAPEMARMVSSTNLALEYLAAGGQVDPKARIVVNHTDADSIMSAGLMSGVLTADPRFGKAAIAADHTGEEDPISDLLQAISRKRDLEFSFYNLELLLNGKAVTEEAEAQVEKRRQERQMLTSLNSEGAFSWVGGVAIIQLAKKLDAAMLPALLPEAQILMLASPAVSDPSRFEMRLRLGLSAANDLRLNELGINGFDPNFGGRWNAGGNGRSNGTDMVPEEYARRLNELLVAWPLRNFDW